MRHSEPTYIAPLQYFGLGDIIFTQTLVRDIADGRRIIWGVEPLFADGLRMAYPDITWVDKDMLNVDYECMDDKVVSGVRILPIRWAAELLGVPYSQVMRAKYDLYGHDFMDWKRLAYYRRDSDRERGLMKLLGIEQGDRYNLINQTYQSDVRGFRKIDIDNGLPNIYLSVLNGYSLFDWSLVIENATEIHTVETSIIYLLELLGLKAREVRIYERGNAGQVLENVKYFLEKEYRYES